MAPRRIDVIINRKMGMVTPTRGVSVFDQPESLDRFGGAYEVGELPDTLRLVQTGRNPHHHEIFPAFEMTFERYEFELAKVSLTPV